MCRAIAGKVELEVPGCRPTIPTSGASETSVAGAGRAPLGDVAGPDTSPLRTKELGDGLGPADVPVGETPGAHAAASPILGRPSAADETPATADDAFPAAVRQRRDARIAATAPEVQLPMASGFLRLPAAVARLLTPRGLETEEVLVVARAETGEGEAEATFTG